MDEIVIRMAEMGDAAGLARVHVDTWRSAYRDIVPEAHLAGLSHERSEERWRQSLAELQTPENAVFVAVDATGEVVGFARCGPARDGETEYPAEIYALYVLPACQGRGVGRLLVQTSVRHMVRHLHTDKLLIYALAENPWRKFYERLGGVKVREKTIEIGGKTLLDVGYGWESMSRLLQEASSIVSHD